MKSEITGSLLHDNTWVLGEKERWTTKSFFIYLAWLMGKIYALNLWAVIFLPRSLFLGH